MMSADQVSDMICGYYEVQRKYHLLKDSIGIHPLADDFIDY